jgi:hypothetical protein
VGGVVGGCVVACVGGSVAAVITGAGVASKAGTSFAC